MDNFQQEVEKLTNQIFQDLRLENLSPQKKKEVLAKIQERFNYIILETLLANLNDEDLTKFKKSLQDEGLSSEPVAQIASQTPNLAEKIEQRLKQEYQYILKDAGVK